jgi:hypothetical protein
MCALQCVVSMTTAALDTDSTLDAALSDGEKLWHRLSATSCAKVFWMLLEKYHKTVPGPEPKSSTCNGLKFGSRDETYTIPPNSFHKDGSIESQFCKVLDIENHPWIHRKNMEEPW